MKLKEWLQDETMSQVDLLRVFQDHGIEVTQGAINKWVNHQRIPRKKEMQLLYNLTNKSVSANDFYEL